MLTRLDDIYRLLETWGYPRQGIDWLRRHRAWVIVGLALLAWGVLIATIWLVTATVWLVLHTTIV